MQGRNGRKGYRKRKGWRETGLAGPPVPGRHSHSQTGRYGWKSGSTREIIGKAMPWEISIINGTRETPKALGRFEDVNAELNRALGVMLKRRPVPPKEWLDQMPESVGEAMLKPWIQADFEGADFSIHFYTVDAPILESVNAEVRGNGSPLPALFAICENTGWSVFDHSTNSMINLLSAGDPKGWEQFRKWRDKAIRGIRCGE